MQRNYQSIKCQNNENPTFGYFTNDIFGMVSYLKGEYDILLAKKKANQTD